MLEHGRFPSVKTGQDILLSVQLVGIAEAQVVTGTVMNMQRAYKLMDLGVSFGASDTRVIKNIDDYVQSLLKLECLPLINQTTCLL